ncbi:DUF998 domain-containing protein [Marisediminicola sp. LYQ85]|uniref:DUF998 domain-containing protein n=1 Tax=Marisediminicola sp. LYQ85 TaxID=3391062 RepID=UPI0039832AE1
MTPARRQRTAGVVLLFGLVYLVFEFVSAAAWVDPPYDWARNYISDLGFADCATVDGDRLCSPLHPLMNAGFMVQGTVFTIGGVLVTRILFAEAAQRVLVASLLVVSGVGTFFVGVFHQSLALYDAGLNGLHVLAATLAIGPGNVGILLLGIFALALPAWRGYALGVIVIAVIGIVAAVALALGDPLGIGIGLVERVAVYPLNTFTIGTGVGLLVRGSLERRARARIAAES